MAEVIATPPLDAAVLVPEFITILPPVVVCDVPADNKIPPPSCAAFPADNFTSPPECCETPIFISISPLPCVPPSAVDISIDPDSPLLSAKLLPVVITTFPEYPVCDVPLSNVNLPPVLLVLVPAERTMLPPTSPVPEFNTISPPIVDADPVDTLTLPLTPAAAFPVRVEICPEAAPDACTSAVAKTAAPLTVASVEPVVTEMLPPVLA